MRMELLLRSLPEYIVFLRCFSQVWGEVWTWLDLENYGRWVGRMIQTIDACGIT